MASTRHRYIVGVDFGTTYTGIAHVDSTKTSIDDIEVFRNWPGSSKSLETCKTPSKIAYRHENPRIRVTNPSSNEEIWGYNVKDGMESYWWFKLRLDQDTILTKHDDDGLAGLPRSREGIMKLPEGKEAVDVCADYLTGIYTYTMSELSRIWGANIINATPIDWWISHPATWSHKAKDLTKTAAMRAGFGTRPDDRIFMISEPEAAAVATLSKLVKPGISDQVHAGDGVLICDCGGGTVDLTTYLITSTDPKLEFEELVVGQGAKIGSTFIDRYFHSWLTLQFGHYFEELSYKQIGPTSRLMKEFESIKSYFGDDSVQQDEFELPLSMHGLPDSDHYDTAEGNVIISKKEMESLFMSSVSKIKTLVLEQLEKANEEMQDGKKISMIVLVGGYGSSKYLYRCMKEMCKEVGEIRLLCPPQPQAAISRGAALRGLSDVAPVRRRSRHSYGFSWGRTFRPGVDPEWRSYISRWHRTKSCGGRTTWQISKGDYTDKTTTIKCDVGKTWQKGSTMVTERVLYSCGNDHAPDYNDAPGVEVVGKIVVDFRGIDLRQFKPKTIKGKLYYRLQFTYVIQLESETGVMQVKALCGGKQVGSTSFDFKKLEGHSSD